MSRELRTHVEEYLRIRRALGFKLEGYDRSLSTFIDHLERIGTSTPTVEAALQWATQPQGVQPFRWKQRLSVVRGFAATCAAWTPQCRCHQAICSSIGATAPRPT